MAQKHQHRHQQQRQHHHWRHYLLSGWPLFLLSACLFGVTFGFYAPNRLFGNLLLFFLLATVFAFCRQHNCPVAAAWAALNEGKSCYDSMAAVSLSRFRRT